VHSQEAIRRKAVASQFFVGQRVKVVREGEPVYQAARSAKIKIGDEGVVLGTDSRPNGGFVHNDSFAVLSVHIDRLSLHGLAPAYCFEPILPEGHRPCEEGWSLDKLLEGLPA
jgi:hypothetical protein